MRKAIPLLLLPLVGGAATPQKPEKSQGPESLLQVGPVVKSVVGGSPTLEPEGDFFRAVLANSEYEPCLIVERVNVRAPHTPRVKESRKYCAFTVKERKFSLAPDKAQDASITNLSWKGFELSFDLAFVDASPGASEQQLRCTLDPRQPRQTFTCDTKGG